MCSEWRSPRYIEKPQEKFTIDEMEIFIIAMVYDIDIKGGENDGMLVEVPKLIISIASFGHRSQWCLVIGGYLFIVLI